MSEGYEIINDILTHTDKEVIKFNLYKNMNRHKTINNQLKIQLDLMRKLLLRIKLGKKYWREFGYSAYTCLVKDCGDLKVF